MTKDAEVREFHVVFDLIRRGRTRAWAAANLELVDLYWALGEHISRKVAREEWGRSTVQRLAAWLATRDAGLRGFSASNLWRMRQFFEAYAGDPDLAALLRDLPWTSNAMILGHCKTKEERAFYLRLAIDQRWSSRELERQIGGALFERSLSKSSALSAVLREKHPGASAIFKDRYVLEFLRLPENHAERDLQRGLVSNLKQFLLELGRDFCFVGEQFCVQVGHEDYFVDLVFFHRGLQALVAPSIGVLLCKGKDKDVVEYALSRTLSPALVAEYETKLPDKAVLRAKMDEIYDLIASNRRHED